MEKRKDVMSKYRIISLTLTDFHVVYKIIPNVHKTTQLQKYLKAYEINNKTKLKFIPLNYTHKRKYRRYYEKPSYHIF